MKFTNLAALSGVQNPTDAQIDQANADLTGAAITNVTLVKDNFITEAAAVSASNTKLTSDLATANEALAISQNATKAANESLATATNSLTAANTKITELEAKVAAFGKNAGALHNANEAGDINAETENELEDVLASMPHNRAADSIMG